MTLTVRWLCLLPDPVTGLDKPVEDAAGQPVVWVAPNREYAVRLVKAALQPARFRLAAVVSVLDWDARKQVKQRRKLTSLPAFGGVNPSRRCWRCGGTTPTRRSRYCEKHTQRKTEKAVAVAVSPSTVRPPREAAPMAETATPNEDRR